MDNNQIRSIAGSEVQIARDGYYRLAPEYQSLADNQNFDLMGKAKICRGFVQQLLS